MCSSDLILAVQSFGIRRRERGWQWFALAMLPALVSAMAACTWHLFDNLPALQGLVVLQAFLTLVGNGSLALAAWWLLQQQGRGESASEGKRWI